MTTIRTTRPIVPNIAGISQTQSYQHEFKPVTPRITHAIGGGYGQPTPFMHDQSGQPTIAKPMASYRGGAVAATSSSSSSTSDPFERKGVISATLAEARALVQQMDSRGGGGGSMNNSNSNRPASLVEPSRPYTPRLSRRTSPLFQQTPTNVPPSPNSTTNFAQYPDLSSSPPDSPIRPNFRPSPFPNPMLSADADEDELAARFTKKFTKKRSSSRASDMNDEGLGGGGGGDEMMNELDSIRSESSLGFNTGGGGGSSRPNSSTIIRSRSNSTISPMTLARKSPSQPTTATASTFNPSSSGLIPELSFPASVGSDEDWRQVESTPGDETSRPGTAASQQAAPISRQGSAGAVRSGIPIQPSTAQQSPSPQPRPPSGSPSSVRPASRSRPTSSTQQTNASPEPTRPTSTNSNSSSAASSRPPSQDAGGMKLERGKSIDLKSDSPAPVRPSSALFARPLVEPGSTPITAAATQPPPQEAEPILDLAALQQLQSTYASSSVVDKPDALRILLTATYRALQSAKLTDELIPLLRFSLALPGGEATSRIHALTARYIFELSRDSKNDSLLIDLLPDILPTLLTKPAKGMKILSCILGALHNLSVEGSSASTSLISQPLVDALSGLLRDETFRLLKLDTNEEELVKFLLEVTAVLRNIACINGAHRLFIQPIATVGNSANQSPLCCLDYLCHLTIRLSLHSSLLLNLTRILSKLSLHQSCRSKMYDPTTIATSTATPSTSLPFLPSLVASLQIHHIKLSLCIRVLYILGNLTMQNDDCRSKIVDCVCTGLKQVKEEDTPPSTIASSEISESMKGMEILLTLLARSYQRDSKLRKLLAGSLPTSAPNSNHVTSSKKHQTMLRENEDLLVKLIRLLANLSINPIIGQQILADKRCAVLLKLLKYKSLETAEELVLNTVSAVTNLSFYLKPTPKPATPSTDSARAAAAAAPTKESLIFFHPPRDVLGLLLSFLFSPNTELLSEVCRSLGNFSRDLHFRLLMRTSRVDEAIILLLDHNDIGVVYGAVGVTLNMAAHQQGQESLFEDDCAALVKMLEIIERFGLPGPTEDEAEPQPSEWPLVCMILKTFLNLRTPAPRPSSAGGSTGGGSNEMILKKEIAPELRMQLLATLEEILDRAESERGELQTNQDADSIYDLQQLTEVTTLANQLMTACIIPTQWQQ